MKRLFIPYLAGIPAMVDIKGHRLLLVSSEEHELEYLSDISGADEFREFELPDGADDTELELARIAGNIDGGVVVAPPGITTKALMIELDNQLPWIQ